MQEKFEKLFYEFQPENTQWGDWCHSPQAYFRGEKAIPGSTLNVGYQVFTAPVDLNTEPHFHREEEYLVFLGAVFPDVFSSWDAEVHLYMGKTLDTMEKVVITEPTFVRIPKGWWHGPLYFKRITKPMFFQSVFHSGRYGEVKYVQHADGAKDLVYRGDEMSSCKIHPEKECNYCGYCFSHPDKVPNNKDSFVPWVVVNEDGIDSYCDAGCYDPEKAPKSTDCVITPEYKSIPYSDACVLKAKKPDLSDEVRKCVLAAPKEKTTWGDWCPSPQTYFRGETYMEDSMYHVGYQVFRGANDMEEPHFHQGVDEYIFFVGADPMNIFDFDAEIDFRLGDDPEHMESKIITRPTVVRVPANTWHCPILFRKMKKPLIFQAALMSGTWGTITKVPKDMQRIAPEGEEDNPMYSKYGYAYSGDNIRMCRYNSKKRCNLCGACFPQQEIIEE